MRTGSGKDEGPFRLATTEEVRVARGVSGRSAEYERYMGSTAWRALRRRVVARDQGRCVGCGARGALQVHHLTYQRLGHEDLADLVTLCAGCHEQWHRHVKRETGPRGSAGWRRGHRVVSRVGKARRRRPPFQDTVALCATKCPSGHWDFRQRLLEGA